VNLVSGSRLGPYEIVSPLGSGGMGEVYKARDPRLNRLVAIKVISGAFADDAERRERFEREAQAIAALNHPGIVTIYSVEQAGSTWFLTMELVEGRPLGDIIPTHGLPLDQALKIAIAVADAMAAAHQKGITHRDLKPANIMVGEREHGGRVKVLDFGLAKIADQATGAEAVTTLPTALATGEGRILGTVTYMSPEQAEGKTIDARSDLFSLGVVLYEMTTGQRPFSGESSIGIISAIVKDEPKPVTTLEPRLPRDLSRIVRRALAKDPERRYQTAKDFRNDLEELKASLDSGEVSASSDRMAPATPMRGVHAWRWAALGAAAVAIGAVALLLLLFVRGSRPAPTATAGQVQMIPLTSSGNADRAVLSPDSKYVAYVQTDASGPSVWIHQIASHSDVQIVAPSASVQIQALTIAPDGSFVDFVKGPGGGELWRVPFLGGPARKIVDYVSSAPAWSPNGKQMAYLMNVLPLSMERQVIVADADGSNPRVVASRRLPRRFSTLTLSSRPDLRPVWRSDGQSLVVLGTDEARPGFELVDIRLATGAETPLYVASDVSASGGGMALASDGRSAFIAMSTAPDDPVQVLNVQLAGGETTRFTNDLNQYRGISVAGDALVATRQEWRSSLWIADASGHGSRQVGRELPARFSGLAWAPNGRVIYGATLPGGSGLWSAGAADGKAELIVPGGHTPSTSTTGTLIFQRDSRELWQADSDGTHAARIPGASGGSPIVAPDGTRVFYISAKSGLQSPWVATLPGGTPRQFAELQVSALGAEVSPDGRLVTFQATGAPETHLMILPVGGGTPVRQLPVPPGFGARHWTPDGRGLAYVDASGMNVLVLPLDGGPPRPLTDFTDHQILDFRWSPDGKQLAVTRAISTSDIVLLKGVGR
jgi:serine/threonine protein kinase/Tol biopolymer transport system component